MIICFEEITLAIVGVRADVRRPTKRLLQLSKQGMMVAWICRVAGEKREADSFGNSIRGQMDKV